MRAAALALVALTGCALYEEQGPAPIAPPAFGTYVVDHVGVPDSAEQARSIGFDLDGDRVGENQLGGVLVSIGDALQLDFQRDTDDAIDTGRAVLLLASVECRDGPCAATFVGTDPSVPPCADDSDTVCRGHLDGTASFDIDFTHPAGSQIHGELTDDRFDGSRGDLMMPMAFPGVEPIWVRASIAHAQLLEVRDDLGTIGGGRIGGASPDADIRGVVMPAMHAAATILIEDAACDGTPPDCGCDPDTSGETLLGVFDDNSDCQVPFDEFSESDLMTTLMRPDVDTDDDGVPDSMSYAIGVSAVRASYALP